MNRKILGILVMTLLIGTTLTSVGMNNEKVNENAEIKLVDDIRNNEFVKGEFIVKFKESPISCVSVDNLNEKYQVKSIVKVFKNSENTILDNVYIFNVPRDSDILSIVKDYSSLSNVKYSEPNYVIHLCGIPNDPDFDKQYSLDNIGQYGGTPGADIDAPEAWDIETGSSDVVIAVIDTGVDYTHPDLADNIWVNEDEIPDNDIDDDGNGYVDDVHGYDFADDESNTLDINGHGTHCAGVVGAVGNNGIGIAGVCWNCKIMPVQIFVEDFSGNVTTFYSRLAQGIKYAADNGADIMSMSCRAFFYSDLLKDSVDYAYDKGIVMVAAAGNDNVNDKVYPGSYDNVIAVGATDNNDSRMDTYDYRIREQVRSNWGDWVDVAAPGEWIYSTYPTYTTITITEYGFNQNYEYCTGTSMATPHVAGLAALILSKNPTYTPDKVKSVICANVDPYDSDKYIGTGRINAYKAITEFNTEPDKPTITGPSSGKPDTEYTFTASAADPDGDSLSYKWDWGDDSISEWLDTAEASHTWTTEAVFNISVRVKDIHGALSDWSDPLAFSTPKNKAISNSFLRFLENHPHLFPLLRQLLDL